jgi:hypothetical protein
MLRHVYFSRLSNNDWGIFSPTQYWRIYIHVITGISAATGGPPFLFITLLLY